MLNVFWSQNDGIIKIHISLIEAIDDGPSVVLVSNFEGNRTSPVESGVIPPPSFGPEQVLRWS